MASRICRSSRSALLSLLLCVGSAAALVPVAQAGENEPASLAGTEPLTFSAPTGGVEPERPSSRGSAKVVVRAGESEVTIRDFEYLPRRLEVDSGTEVTWTNFDTAEHSATDIGGDFDTGLLADNESGSVTLDKAGTYDYICSLHPEMTGSLVVTDDSDPGGNGGSGNGGGVQPSGGDPDAGSGAGTSSGDGSGTTGFDSGATATRSAETLPTTGFEVLKLIVAAALLAAAGLLLAALEVSLRPLPRGPNDGW